MKPLVLIALLAFPTASHAVDLSLSKASSIKAAPAGSVMRTDMAPPDGMSASPPRSRPVYEVTEYRMAGAISSMPTNIPKPAFNPVRVSFCPSEVH